MFESGPVGCLLLQTEEPLHTPGGLWADRHPAAQRLCMSTHSAAGHLFFSFTRAAFSAALSCTVSCMGAADAAACPPPPPLLPLLPLCVCAIPPLPLPCPLNAGPIGVCRQVPQYMTVSYCGTIVRDDARRERAPSRHLGVCGGTGRVSLDSCARRSPRPHVSSQVSIQRLSPVAACRAGAAGAARPAAASQAPCPPACTSPPGPSSSAPWRTRTTRSSSPAAAGPRSGRCRRSPLAGAAPARSNRDGWHPEPWKFKTFPVK